MSPRKTILRELAGAGGYTRPSSIPGFTQEPEKYQKAVNELLSSRLLEGKKDDEGHMTIALNEHRRREIDREIRPVWARPAIWMIIILLVAAVGAGLAI